MKAARSTRLTTPDFKAFLGLEAPRGGIGGAVRARPMQAKIRCGQIAFGCSDDPVAQVDSRSHEFLNDGLVEANAVLIELRMGREAAARVSASEPASRKSRNAVAGAKA